VTSVITLNPAIRYQFKTGRNECTRQLPARRIHQERDTKRRKQNPGDPSRAPTHAGIDILPTLKEGDSYRNG